MSQIAAKEVLYEAYDVSFGVFDHLKQSHQDARQGDPALKRPLASVALHPIEAWASKGKQLDTVLNGYVANEVGATFNLSLIEFLDLPVEYAEMVMRICRENLQRKTNDVANQQAGLEAAAGTKN